MKNYSILTSFFLLSIVSAGSSAMRKEYIAIGDDYVYTCRSKPNSRMLRISDSSGYTFVMVRNEEPQKIQGSWLVDSFSSLSETLQLSLRLTNFRAENSTRINCGDEREDGPRPVQILPYKAPKMTLTVNQDVLDVDELIQVTCSANGGVPAVSFSWIDSLGRRYSASRKKDNVSQSCDSAKTKCSSTVSVRASADLDGEVIRCEVNHGGRTIQESTNPLKINYAPNSASINLAYPLQDGQESLSAKCVFNGRPLPETITYLIQDDLQSPQREIRPSNYSLSLADSGKLLRCKVSNNLGSTISEAVELQVSPAPTTLPHTYARRETTVAMQSDQAPFTKDIQTTISPYQNLAGVANGGNSTRSAELAEEQKGLRAASNVAIACVTIAFLLTILIGGILVKRRLHRKSESCGTDITTYDETVSSLKDHELESKFKKEYFM
ncbi:Oidioi.mRNA.OKI2018_I69.chr2.g5387.t1.cds [Oikopleura dioica]|uniref:Oidioi.mRNA.OKI2018_I69.chr2.g5387.t1.cds n=1 Tax=Oikopleura dioica TaxID=34765 RepID=A0ABN7T0A3_OIKDI|nr:Oidioi.mRNA.OKI2018_I69.chr2.g5387.t1.cds [Oikopleura dioica]